MTDRYNKLGSRNIHRRSFLAASAGVLGSLAGCMSGSTGSGSSTSFTYWNEINTNTRAAKETTKKSIKQFESSSDANVKVNFSGYSAVLGAKWLTSFKNGNYPVLYDSVSTWNGQFVKGGWVKPFDEYRDAFDQETIDAIKWIFPLLKTQYRGFEETNLWDVPFGFLAQVPFVVRTDHLEKAGFDPEKDFPPESYDELIDIATTLQRKGPGEYGYQIHGSKFDVTDCMLPQWAVAQGGKQGLFLNEDWSDTNLDTQLWIDTVSKYVDVYRKYNLSNSQTPSSGDEDVVPLMRQGKASMSSTDFLNLPTFMNQATKLMKSGSVKWGASWPGPKNQRAIIQPYTFGVTKKPEKADKGTYEKKQEAAIDFVKRWLSKDFQRNLHENFGLIPVRKDVWGDIKKHKHNGFDAMLKMTKNADLGWSAHPHSVSIQYTTTAPYIQKALSGDLTPEEACKQAAKDVRSFL